MMARQGATSSGCDGDGDKCHLVLVLSSKKKLTTSFLGGAVVDGKGAAEVGRMTTGAACL